MLVAAGQVVYVLFHRGRLYAQLFSVFLGFRVFQVGVQHAFVAHEAQARQGDVVLYGIGQHQPVALAVLGDICQARFHRVRHGVQANFLAVFEQLPADMSAVCPAEHALAQLRAPRAYQSGYTHDLALAQIDGHVVHHLALRIQGVMHRPVLDLERYRPDLDSLALGETVGHFTPDHALYYARLGEVVGLLVQRLYGLAVADDGYVVRHIGDLVQFVGNDDRCDVPGILKQQEQVQQVLAVRLGQGGRGLVKYQQAHVLGQRLGDLDQLLLAGADVLYQLPGRVLQTHYAHELDGVLVGGVPVDHALALFLFVAQEHVFGYGKVRHQRQFLVDYNDALAFGIADLLETAFLPVVQDIAFVCAVRMDSAEHLHKGGLARAVFAHQRVDLAVLHLKVNVVQRLYARKRLGNAPHFQKIHRISPFCRINERNTMKGRFGPPFHESGKTYLPRLGNYLRSSSV